LLVAPVVHGNVRARTGKSQGYSAANAAAAASDQGNAIGERQGVHCSGLPVPARPVQCDYSAQDHLVAVNPDRADLFEEALSKKRNLEACGNDGGLHVPGFLASELHAMECDELAVDRP